MIVEQDIRITDVFVYAEDTEGVTPLLNGISLRISQGEWVNVVGRNGSGKSTLAQVLTGILPPHEGVIQRGFAGQEPIPYVMQQEGQLFGDTPWDDVVFLLEVRGIDADTIPNMAISALSRVGLTDHMHRRVSELSGGQKQLAATAGCLASGAPLLLFDEATSMLDSSSRLQVLEAVMDLHKKGATVIWLTHHMDELAAGERVIAMQEGEVVFDGSVASFFLDDLCEELGFELPFPVQVAKELQSLGVPLSGLPLTAEQLVEAVSGREE